MKTKKPIYPHFYLYWGLKETNGLLDGIPMAYVTSTVVGSYKQKQEFIKQQKKYKRWLTDFDDPKMLDKVEKYIPEIRAVLKGVKRG